MESVPSARPRSRAGLMFSDDYGALVIVKDEDFSLTDAFESK